MAIGFIMWSMASFDKQNFAICGRTIEALRRNVIVHIPTWLEGMFEVTERRSENKMVVTIGNRSNTYYLFGGRDESSYTLIQGITLAGVLFDEVALMPRSFVEQAMARCSVSGSKFWFNCNPESPGHWFYKEWIRKAAERNMLYLHFTMDDNLSLDEKIKARYEGMYSGVFYDRYIRGLWTVAEGLIYTMFNKDYHVVPSVPRDYEEYLISCDYGTLNPTSAGLWGLCEGKWYRVREYYYDGRKERYQRTDEEHYAAIEELAGDLSIRKIIVDPSAASFIEVIRRHDRFMVEQASNRVLDGIRDVATPAERRRHFLLRLLHGLYKRVRFISVGRKSRRRPAAKNRRPRYGRYEILRSRRVPTVEIQFLRRCDKCPYSRSLSSRSFSVCASAPAGL